MLSGEQLRLATEGNLNPRPLTPEDLQFKIVRPIDEPRGYQRLPRMIRNNLIRYGVPAGFAVWSGCSGSEGIERFNKVASLNIDSLYAGLAYAAVATAVAIGIFTQPERDSDSTF